MRHAVARVLLGAWLALAGGGGAVAAEIELKVIGGLAGIRQYLEHEVPFWTRRVPELTRGVVRADIAPFDRSGIRATEMLQLMRLGVVPFGNVILTMAAADEPELNAVDLPVMNPDIAALRRSVALWRPYLTAILRERYGIELLAVFTYPPQVVFCRQAFSGLSDLAGRRVRTSAVGQSELVEAFGGAPVVMAFQETAAAMRSGAVDCAITAAMSGHALGLHEVSTHVSRLAVSWGVSVFAANTDSWFGLPAEVRTALRDGLRSLEAEIWDAANRDAEHGLECVGGRPDCGGRRGRLVIVEERWQDEARRTELLRDAVLPRWVQRCGAECVGSWNRYLAPALGLWARSEP